MTAQEGGGDKMDVWDDVRIGKEELTVQFASEKGTEHLPEGLNIIFLKCPVDIFQQARLRLLRSPWPKM